MKSTILELTGAAAIVFGLALIQPLALIVAGGVVLLALGYTRGDN